jgi:hypothetical protein
MSAIYARDFKGKYTPLILVEIYLISTVLLFSMGPVDFAIHNEILFWLLIVFYHLFFIMGYCVGVGSYFNKGIKHSSRDFSSKMYWILFCLGIIGVWAAYKNIMMMDGLIPYDFFENLIRGFTEPGLAYAERMQELDSFSSSSRLFNIVFMVFAFAKMLFVFYFIYYWSHLNLTKKITALFYSLLYMSAGFSAGVNSIIFIFIIFSLCSLLVIAYEVKYPHFKKVVIFATVLFLLPVSWFGKIMSERGGGFDYFASTAPLRDIGVSSSFVLDASPSVLDFFYYSFVWLCYYVCQGYYGFSLILNLDFQWTYGFGNSEFLQRQFLMITGVDIAPATFQSRIDHLWDKSAQWHSFYSQVANDVGIVGVAFVMMLIGFLFARAWSSAIVNKSFYALALIPIFIIMFVFFPANNQVFGYIDTFSYFLFVSLFWVFESKKIRI